MPHRRGSNGYVGLMWTIASNGCESRRTKNTGWDRINNLPDWLADRLLRRRRFMATWEF